MTTSTGSFRYNPPPSCDNPGRREKRSLWYRAHRYRRQLRFDEPLLTLYPDTPVISSVFPEKPSTLHSVLARAYVNVFGKQTGIKRLISYNLGKGRYK